MAPERRSATSTLADDPDEHGAKGDSQRRTLHGFGWGVAATVAMSLLMLLGVGMGVAPMPKPIPVALVASIFGLSQGPLLVVLAVASHLAYGGFWGAVLARVTIPATVWKGLVLGIILWLIMQVVVLPILGWGVFGTAITPAIAGATLVLHLVYGATLGALLDRNAAGHEPGDTVRTG